MPRRCANYPQCITILSESNTESLCRVCNLKENLYSQSPRKKTRSANFFSSKIIAPRSPISPDIDPNKSAMAKIFLEHVEETDCDICSKIFSERKVSLEEKNVWKRNVEIYFLAQQVHLNAPEIASVIETMPTIVATILRNFNYRKIAKKLQDIVVELEPHIKQVLSLATETIPSQ